MNKKQEKRGPKGLSKKELQKIVDIEEDIYKKTGVIVDIY
jgi:hypothetical protein